MIRQDFFSLSISPEHFIFGIEGAAAAIRGNLDLLGLMVLAFSTALAGGVVRDLLIGAVPPEAIRNWRYAATAFVAALTAFFFYRIVEAFPSQQMMLLDARAFRFSPSPEPKRLSTTKSIRSWRCCSAPSQEWVAAPFAIFFSHTFLGCFNRIFTRPLRWLAGAVALVVLRKLGISPALAAIVGGISCFMLRVVAVHSHWNLPRIANP